MNKYSAMAPSSSSHASMEEDVYIFPTSFTQQSLWFLHQLEPQSAVYNMPSAIRLSFSVNEEALERSLNAIVQRHEVLRTTFSMQDGQPAQVVKPALSIPLPMVDLRAFPRSEREGKARDLAVQEAIAPFHLAQGPLIRATLVRLGEEEFVLLVNLHHSIADG